MTTHGPNAPRTSKDILSDINGGGTPAQPKATSQTPTQPGAVRYDANGNAIGYVGVPDNYIASSRPEPMSGISRPDSIDPARVETSPLYEAGYEETLARMSPDDVARLQYQMIDVGLIGPKTNFRLGQADPTTISAYKGLITYANRYGLNQSQAMTSLQNNPLVNAAGTAGGADGPTRTVTDPVFTDPLTARATVRDAMQSRLGRAPTADEYNQFRAQLTNSEGGQDIVTTTPSVGKDGVVTSHVTRNDNTTDPTAADMADDFTRKGKLGVEANTHQAGTSSYDLIADLIGAH